MSKINMYKITNTIAAGETTGTTFSVPIRGRILTIKTKYTNTTPGSSSDRDVNIWEMDTADEDDTTDAHQEILDIGTLGAVPTDDNAIYYPRTKVQDYQGVDVDLSDSEGGNTAKYEPFLVFGRVMLQVTAAAEADITTVYLMVEEF